MSLTHLVLSRTFLTIIGCCVGLWLVPDRNAMAQAVGANDPFSIQWAWSERDRTAAGEGFWPQFRGPSSDGHASNDADPPRHWSEDSNVQWKVPLNGRAWSSPVVWKDTIWLTNASEDGKQMSVVAIDRHTGEIRFNKLLIENERTQPDFHAFNSYASPTPVLDAENVYVTFGAYGTMALRQSTAEVIWERRDLPCNHYRGAGSSPILFRDLLIFHMDGYDFQYVVALNKATGATVWKTDRQVNYGTEDGDIKKSFSTPRVIQVGTELQLISPTSKAVLAYDPVSGNELWKLRYEEFSPALCPVYHRGSLYLNSGFSKAKLLAIDPQGQGDVTATHLRWSSSRAVGSKPSLLAIGDRICTLDDRGILSALSLDTGEPAWIVRLGGDFSASPVYAKGRIYCFDEQGKGHVYSESGEQLAVNSLPDGCLASPAIIGKNLIVRTRSHLYCLGNKN